MAEAPRRRLPPLSARLRIVAWLMLTTTLVVTALLLTTYLALLEGIRTEADEEITQEADEFRRFAVEVGVDPTTTRPFTSSEALLRTYIERQFPSEDEVILGVVRGDPTTGADPVEVYQERRLATRLVQDEALLRRIVDGSERSGTTQTAIGEMRWGRVDIATGGAATDAVLVIAEYVGRDVAEARSTTARAASVAGLGLLGAGGIAWLVAGRILAPVRMVREAAAEITEEDLTRRIPVEGKDDIAALASQFNAMLDRLEDAFVAQRDFLDDAAHELRTPITVVRGHLELMGEDPAERAATLRLVDDELDRMNRLVTDLLLLAKSRRPDFVRASETDVADLTIELEAKVAPLGDRRWRLEHVADGTAVLDGQRVTQALLQLASNAAHHTRPGDEIRLGSRFAGSRVHFWVHDSGPGVPAHETETIFQRFARGGSAQLPGSATGATHERPGSGLGLAIVRAIAEAHGGAVRLTSGAGQGARFLLDLPVGAGGPRGDDQADDQADGRADTAELEALLEPPPVPPPDPAPVRTAEQTTTTTTTASTSTSGRSAR